MNYDYVEMLNELQFTIMYLYIQYWTLITMYSITNWFCIEVPDAMLDIISRIFYLGGYPYNIIVVLLVIQYTHLFR